MYIVTKTYGHERGLSCCFRQWRATHSHCQFLHGYSLAFEIKFGSETLNENNWVIDFGGLDWLGNYLKSVFDHKTAVAKDDPQYDAFIKLSELNLADVVIFDRVGCESFAENVFKSIQHYLEKQEIDVKVISVKCSEHGSNSATYTGEK